MEDVNRLLMKAQKGGKQMEAEEGRGVEVVGVGGAVPLRGITSSNRKVKRLFVFGFECAGQENLKSS